MPDEFTLNELQKVYEAILGSTMDVKSFRRRILAAKILEETGKTKQTSRRPAALYSQLFHHFDTRTGVDVFYFLS